MSFSFFKPSKAGSSPSDLVKAMRESLLALDTKTVAKYVELPNFDIASDALATFKDSLTKHETAVAQFLGSHYEQVFVANPNKPRVIIKVLANNHAKLLMLLHNLLMLLHNLPTSKGEDEQVEEERDLIIKEIERLPHPSQAAT